MPSGLSPEGLDIYRFPIEYIHKCGENQLYDYSFHAEPEHRYLQTKPNLTKPNQTKQNKTKPYQTKLSLTKPNLTLPNQTKPYQTKQNQNNQTKL